MLTILLITLIVVLLVFNTYLYRKAYFYKPDGRMIVSEQDDGKMLFSLELNNDPSEFPEKNFLIFKVVNEGGS